MANLLTRVPKRAQPGVATMVRTIYQQLSPAEVHGQLDRVVEQLREPFPQVAELLADAAPDILAFTAFPVAHWQKLWSNNPQERLNITVALVEQGSEGVSCNDIAWPGPDAAVSSLTNGWSGSDCHEAATAAGIAVV